jgi:predicted RNase H-like nuclease (RuvC/YqgF family)
MKTQYLWTFAIALLSISSGCKQSNDTLNVNSANDPQAERVKADLKETAQATQDYAYTQKEQFIAKMNTEITRLKAQSSELESKLESCTGSTKEELRSRLETLRHKVTGLNDQLSKAKNSNEGTWNDVKSTLQKGTDEAKESFNQARQWLSDKLKP